MQAGFVASPIQDAVGEKEMKIVEKGREEGVKWT